MSGPVYRPGGLAELPVRGYARFDLRGAVLLSFVDELLATAEYELLDVEGLIVAEGLRGEEAAARREELCREFGQGFGVVLDGRGYVGVRRRGPNDARLARLRKIEAEIGG